MGCEWKYGLNFLEAIARARARANFSISRYLVSASTSRLLMYYTDHWIFSSSLTRASEIAYSVTARYRYSSSPPTGFESSGGLLRYSLSDLNAYSHLSSHENFLLPFNESKKGRHLSMALEIKLLRAATLPIKL